MSNYNQGYREPILNTRSVVFNLIAINVIVFILCNVFRSSFPYGAPEFFLGLHYPSSDYFRPYQIITHMFMHGGIGHIFFNMFNLYIFGTILERVWGWRRFLEFYFITGLGAVGLYLFTLGLEIYSLSGSFAPPTPVVMSSPELVSLVNMPNIGASGAVFGLQAAFALLFPNTELMIMFIPVPIKAKYLIGGLMVYELFMGIANNPNDHVAHFAHLGGALIAYIVLRIWNRNRNFLY
jgi:membrane associated rhomboid family serine protease